jgi:hypothetical protein
MKWLYKFNESINRPAIDDSTLESLKIKLSTLYKIVGFPPLIEKKTTTFHTNNRKFGYISFKFLTNITVNRTSIVNLLCLHDAIGQDALWGDTTPTKYGRTIYPKKADSDVEYVSELVAYLSIHDMKKHYQTIFDLTSNPNDTINFQTFNTINPEELFTNLNNFVIANLRIFDKHKLSVMLGSNMKVVSIDYTKILIDFIEANNNYHSTEIIFPESVLNAVKMSIDKFSEQNDIWNHMKNNNPILYNALKTEDTDKAAGMDEMGFSD